MNNTYLEELEKAGLKASGINSSTGLVEIVELPKNDWFIGVQFHPEYKSTVENPHPLFVSFISACLNYNKSKNNMEENKIDVYQIIGFLLLIAAIFWWFNVTIPDLEKSANAENQNNAQENQSKIIIEKTSWIYLIFLIHHIMRLLILLLV